ncbi:mPR-typeG-protein-coupled receptor [Aureobasidium pullulans]|nr:mPR-typeG-protein-coupled receptor [Aureobasidium pullulans]
MGKTTEKTPIVSSGEDVGNGRLLTFDEIPSWQKCVCPYRKERCKEDKTDTFQDTTSIFAQDTVNTHSHSIGAIIFSIILPFHFYTTLYQAVPEAQPIDGVVFLIYFAGVAACFACSALFHTVGNHSQHIHGIYNRVDCCGIVLLMWGASLASIHFAFICNAHLRSLHWFLSSASASGCITFILGPMFIKPAYRTARALTYLSLGLFAIVFIVHGIYLYGFMLQRKRLALEWMGLMALFNFLGCTAYVFRFPEVKFTGRFDLVGHSHQIMHVAVLIAGLVHYHGLSQAFLETRGGEMRICRTNTGTESRVS